MCMVCVLGVNVGVGDLRTACGCVVYGWVCEYGCG